MFEVPVHFYSVSPEQVKRTTILDGLQSIGTIVLGRLRPAAPRPAHVSMSAEAADTAPRRA
jgi:hypothetical protein